MFKNILTKGDKINILKAGSPQLKILYGKLECLMPKGLYKMLYADIHNKLCYGYQREKISIKYSDSVIEQCYLIETVSGQEICKTLNEAICIFLKAVIKINGGCHGFKFDMEYIDLQLIPQEKEKWFYNTGGIVNFKDYIYNIINHYDLDEWKRNLDLTKKNCFNLIDSMLMHKIYGCTK